MTEQETVDPVRARAPSAADIAEEKIVSNLMQAITRLQDDLDRVELWTAALNCFLHPVPDYRPADDYVLPHGSGRASRRS
jgi:hypothetical protein